MEHTDSSASEQACLISECTGHLWTAEQMQYLRGNNRIVTDISFIATAYCTPPGTDTMQVGALRTCRYYPGSMICSKITSAVARYTLRWALVQIRMLPMGSQPVEEACFTVGDVSC